MSAVLDDYGGKDFEPLEQPGGLGAAVGLDDADHHVEALGPFGARRLQHGVGLPDARRGAEEHLELAPPRPGLFVVDAAEEGLGVRSLVSHEWKLEQSLRGRMAPEQSSRSE